MTEQRDQIVRRVVHALADDADPAELVREYFDADRSVVVEATRQTLEATGEDVPEERLAATVDRELIEALRLPPEAGSGALPSLYLNRRKVAVVSAVLAALASALAVFVP